MNGLITLPSGAKYCRVPSTIYKGRNDADAYCKSIGLSGLLEMESNADYAAVAALNQSNTQFNLAYHLGAA